MGQKTHPTGFRLGYLKPWDSRWFARGKEYRKQLHEGLALRKELKKRFFQASVASIEFERMPNLLTIIIRSGRPGIIIGHKGTEVNQLRDEISKRVGKPVKILIDEVRNPDTNAQLIAENVANQLERRMGFRRAMKKVLENAERRGALGVKIICSGRLGGADMSRTERYIFGRVPLHTIRADIDYALAEASTSAGKVGVKVWVFNGEKIPDGTPLTGAPVNEAKSGGRGGGGGRRGGGRGGDKRGGRGSSNRGGGNRGGGSNRGGGR